MMGTGGMANNMTYKTSQVSSFDWCKAAVVLFQSISVLTDPYGASSAGRHLVNAGCFMKFGY